MPEHRELILAQSHFNETLLLPHSGYERSLEKNNSMHVKFIAFARNLPPSADGQLWLRVSGEWAAEELLRAATC